MSTALTLHAGAGDWQPAAGARRVPRCVGAPECALLPKICLISLYVAIVNSEKGCVLASLQTCRHLPVLLPHLPSCAAALTLHCMLAQVDIKDTDNEIVIKADTPGIDGADISVRLPSA